MHLFKLFSDVIFIFFINESTIIYNCSIFSFFIYFCIFSFKPIKPSIKRVSAKREIHWTGRGTCKNRVSRTISYKSKYLERSPCVPHRDEVYHVSVTRLGNPFPCHSSPCHGTKRREVSESVSEMSLWKVHKV